MVKYVFGLAKTWVDALTFALTQNCFGIDLESLKLPVLDMSVS